MAEPRTDALCAEPGCTRLRYCRGQHGPPSPHCREHQAEKRRAYLREYGKRWQRERREKRCAT